MSWRYSFPSIKKITSGYRRVKSKLLENFPELRRTARDYADRRQDEQRQRLLEQIGPPIIQKVNMTNIDLYEIYLLRLKDATPHGEPFDKIRSASILYNDSRFQNVKPVWFNIPFITQRRLEPLIFTIFISILLGCDKTHDFTRERVRKELANKYSDPTLKNNVDELLEHSREVTIDQVYEVCYEAVTALGVPDLNHFTLLGHCVCIINLELRNTGCKDYMPKDPNVNANIYSSQMLGRFFFGDGVAKNVAFAISRLLGICMVEHERLIPDATATNIVKELTPNPLFFAEWDSIIVKIDATSSTVNNVEDFVRIRHILSRPEQLLVLDSASANDPAETGSLGNIFRDFNRCHYQYYNQAINVFVRIGNTNVNILTATLQPQNEMVGLVDPTQQGLTVPDIKLRVSMFLGRDMSNHDMAPKTNSLSSVITKIAKKWNGYKGNSHILTPTQADNFRDMVAKYTMEKTLGDFLQIISYAASPKPKVFITVDRITGIFAGILGSTVILDGGTTDTTAFRKLFVTRTLADSRQIGIIDICRAVISGPPADMNFGKINKNFSKRLKLMSNLELKNKLKTVGIKITKNVRGKRKYLTRKELENKAILFNKLQNTAKKMKIKLMYKSRNGNGNGNGNENGIVMYKYKTYKRLQNEIKKMKLKTMTKTKIISMPKSRSKTLSKRSSFG